MKRMLGLFLTVFALLATHGRAATPTFTATVTATPTSTPTSVLPTNLSLGTYQPNNTIFLDWDDNTNYTQWFIYVNGISRYVVFRTDVLYPSAGRVRYLMGNIPQNATLVITIRGQIPGQPLAAASASVTLTTPSAPFSYSVALPYGTPGSSDPGISALGTVVAAQATAIAGIKTDFEIGPTCQTCSANVAIYAMPALNNTTQHLEIEHYLASGTPVAAGSELPVNPIPALTAQTTVVAQLGSLISAQQTMTSAQAGLATLAAQQTMVALQINSNTNTTNTAGVVTNTAPGLLATPLAGVNSNTAPGLVATPLAGINANTAPALLATPLAGISSNTTNTAAVVTNTAPGLLATPLAGVNSNTAPGLLATPLAGVNSNTAPSLLATPLAGINTNTAPGILATPIAQMSAKFPPALGPQPHNSSQAHILMPLSITGAAISGANQSDVFDVQGYTNIAIELVSSSWVDGGGSKVLFFASNDQATWTTMDIYQDGQHQINGINASQYAGKVLHFPFFNARYISVSCTAITSGSFSPWLYASAAPSATQLLPDTANMNGSSLSNGTKGMPGMSAQLRFESQANNNNYVRDAGSLHTAWTAISTATSNNLITPPAGTTYHLVYADISCDTTGQYIVFDSAGATKHAFYLTANANPYHWQPFNDVFGSGNNTLLTILGPASSHISGSAGYDKH